MGLPTTVLAAGTQAIAKFSITADAGGTVAWDRVVFTIATTTASLTSTSTTIKLYDNDDQATSLSTCVLTAVGTSITCSDVNKEVSGTKTYVLKAEVGGTITAGAAVSTYIAQPSSLADPDRQLVVEATTASFIWSDESVSGHSATTADWMNDYLIKNLPTDSQTLSK